jgi:long-chain fatty acid transport protein
MSIDDDAWGWNLGVLFTVSPTTKVGFSYRSTIQYHTDGKVKLSGDGTRQAMRPRMPCALPVARAT